MRTVLIILEPFCLIALGFALARSRAFAPEFWSGLEKLVYYVLLPAMLFRSVAAARLALSEASVMLALAVGVMLAGVLISWIVSRMAPAGPMTDASVRQCGYRFNNYIGFALVAQFAGGDGIALFALIMSLWVPACNVLAVTDLALAANKGSADPGAILKSLASNPIILSTAGGLAWRASGLALPEFIDHVCRSLGSGSLAPALMAIGAGLQFGALAQYRRLFALATLQRLVVLPALAFAAGLALALPPAEFCALLCFCLLPTGNSCYILAVRMGGNGPAVASLTALQTVAAVLTIPAWILLAQACTAAFP